MSVLPNNSARTSPSSLTFTAHFGESATIQTSDGLVQSPLGVYSGSRHPLRMSKYFVRVLSPIAIGIANVCRMDPSQSAKKICAFAIEGLRNAIEQFYVSSCHIDGQEIRPRGYTCHLQQSPAASQLYLQRIAVSLFLPSI